MNRLQNFLGSFISSAFPEKKQPQPTIDSYGQSASGLSEDQIQQIMEWLFLSLVNVGYDGNAHLIWYNDADTDLEPVLKEARRFNEPTFLYRCGDRTASPLSGYYWRLMNEHPSTRIYQLEVREDE